MDHKDSIQLFVHVIVATNPSKIIGGIFLSL